MSGRNSVRVYTAIYTVHQETTKSSQAYCYVGASKLIQSMHMLQKLWSMWIVILKQYM